VFAIDWVEGEGEPYDGVGRAIQVAGRRIQLKRRGNPYDAVQWITYLADPAAEWVTGQVIAVDGGFGLT
jgi:NAD(P)-dependent dehydrogenase (short-subunit alcohol dehydrogenase family)